MKKTVLTVAALAVLAVPLSSTGAEKSFYIQGNLGLGIALDTDVEMSLASGAETAKASYDAGFVTTWAWGYSFNDMLRTEIEYGWQKNDLDRLSYSNEYGNFSQGDLKTQTYMTNGYFNAETGSPWSPFVGAGIGFAKVELNTPGLGSADNDATFAYQLMAGVAYSITEVIIIDAQYRFVGSDDATLSGGGEYNLRTNNLMMGARFNF